MCPLSSIRLNGSRKDLKNVTEIMMGNYNLTVCWLQFFEL